MKLDINPRGNGACPICQSNADCRLKRALAEALRAQDGLRMEIAIYQCPKFKEKV